MESAVTDLAASLLRLTPAERRDELARFLRQRVVEILFLPDDYEVGPRTSLFDLPLDSLKAVDLKNAIESRLGLPLPSSIAFDHPTIEDLTTHLLERLQAEAGPAAPVARSRAREDAIAIVGMACRFPGGANDPETGRQHKAS